MRDEGLAIKQRTREIAMTDEVGRFQSERKRGMMGGGSVGHLECGRGIVAG
jgi:hypothetical protein